MRNKTRKGQKEKDQDETRKWDIMGHQEKNRDQMRKNWTEQERTRRSRGRTGQNEKEETKYNKIRTQTKRERVR